jgi:hypothetical protein
MKHTLNVLTLTALAAAASAQTAPASGLNYNTITASRSQRDNSLAVQGVLGQSNFIVGLATGTGDYSDTSYSQVGISYLFRNVTNGIDATVGVIQGNWEETVYTVQIRRELNEIYAGLELSAGYASTLQSDTTVDFQFGGYGNDEAESSYYVGLTYNINKTFAVGVSLVKPTGYPYGTDYDRATVWSVRASF